MNRNTRIETTEYFLGDRFHRKLAVVADLHDSEYSELMELLAEQKPDIICIPGDLSGRHFSDYLREGIRFKLPEHALGFLKEAGNIAPVFMSRGNHEHRLDALDVGRLANLGVRFVENNWQRIDGICIAGMPSAWKPERRNCFPQNTAWLDDFEKEGGFRILLCHHPEYYDTLLKDRSIDLVLSGHAHGGQVRLGNHGLYAPGQGFLPKYTSGLIDGKMIVSRGLANNAIFPRINNAPELVIVRI